MDFKKIPNQYRPVPFWSWNEQLDIDETASQVQQMHDVGIGGFFMHARGGLQTEYLSEEWFANVKSAIDTAAKNGMHPWAYDENGWPSGFGSGVVNGLGIKYQQKYLRMSDTEPSENIIAKCNGHWFYFDVNPFYVDTLDKNVIKKFIEVAYQPYYDRFGDNFDGFFTDEPQISRNGIPWSFVFEEEYTKRYGKNILEHLDELFLPIGDYTDTRVKFWKMVTDLFSEGFMKQIYDWCNEHNLKLTGHLVLEEDLMSQLTTNGACMPHYEYMHIPGMDWLGRSIFDCLTPMQVSSVSEQLGKSKVLSETFALCGHNVSFAELKGMYEWQMVHGINLLCPHLEGYSIRGIRKRDYPPAMYLQQPWWNEYKNLVEALSREGMILAEGKKSADTLVLHPQTTAWSLFDGNEDNNEINNVLLRTLCLIKNLESKHIPYHLGDETIMERHATVENGRLIIGNQAYSRIISDHCAVLLDSTKKLLADFEKSGGKIVTAEDIPANDITDNGEITYKKCSFDEFDVHFFVNTSPDRKTASFNITAQKLNILTGETEAFSGEHEFEPWGSLMLIESPCEKAPKLPEKNYIKISDTAKIVTPVQNALTLDFCDYSFDGELIEKNGYVLNICERANALERAVKIHQDYRVNIEYIPDSLYMVCETPEKFKICVNGTAVHTPCGYFVDKSLKKIDISHLLKLGENVISFDCDFVQSDKFYQNLRNAWEFESEKNKLAYDMEIEPIYLIGNFSVKTDGEWTKLDKNAYRYKGGFSICKPCDTINVKNIEKQGYPFFCGTMVLDAEIDIVGENPVLDLDIKGINAVKVEINGKEKLMLWDTQLPLSEFEASGKTKIRLTITNNLRNLLGPHHLIEGESYSVGPSSFFKERCIWKQTNAESACSQSPDCGDDWIDDYCFVETGLL